MWKQHERIGELNTKNAELLVELTEKVKINADYQERVQSLHQLDTKHTQELANAKIQIDKLRNPMIFFLLYNIPLCHQVGIAQLKNHKTN